MTLHPKWGPPGVASQRLIIPRECPSLLTEHCIGTPNEMWGSVRCDFCGKFMPLEEAISFFEADPETPSGDDRD